MSASGHRSRIVHGMIVVACGALALVVGSMSLHTLERAVCLAGAGPILPAHLGARDSDAAAEETPRLALGDRSLRAMEEALIRRVLAEDSGNRSRVARILGINRTTLYNKLKSYGIEDAASRP